MACADINRQTANRLWKNIHADDNDGQLFLNNNRLSTFRGDMLDTDAGAGVSQNNGHWYIVGYEDYSYEKPELFMRRCANEAVNTFRAEVDVKKRDEEQQGMARRTTKKTSARSRVTSISIPRKSISGTT